MELREIPLVQYLESKSPIYHAKILEMRDEVARWLGHIVHTFPHYTGHTAEHSEQIILQVSNLLFNDAPEPLLMLSAVEVYILIAAAYLHDAGMVVSDDEKAKILASSEWKTWVTGEGGGVKRWNEIESLIQANEPYDVVQDFHVNIQLRFLVAEFVRKTHHMRAADVIAQYQPLLGRFAFDDRMLQNTIADVCVAHGLAHYELENRDRYPDRRDIRGQKVNVRFLAIMLRLGDLLDMSTDRACPLLLNAACPLPSDSYAHWTQYQRFTHQMIAPETIEITAMCQSQDEHVFLRDWCEWLVNEVQNARILMARSARHGEWQAPIVSLDGQNPTIRIERAIGATYLPLEWQFELDSDTIFNRLVNDIYNEPLAFVRELIQNALDATRCQMYADLIAGGSETPEYPTQVAQAFRDNYPIRISLTYREWQNELSGEVENRQILVVEDRGIGMDQEIIRRYFLQVGRSYYKSEEFHRDFPFFPTSQFGLGFLSVFAVSDHVVVDTLKLGSPNNEGPIRLTLKGPRNYLLIQQSPRSSRGTRIEVILREPLEQGQLTRQIQGWCRRVEFPVVVYDLDQQTTVIAERPDQFTYEMPDVTTDNAIFAVRAFPINRSGIEGELYVFARTDDRGESWADWNYAQYAYPDKHPQAVRPPFPNSLVCLHGIATRGGGGFHNNPMSVRLDYRNDTYHPTLSRDSIRGRRVSEIETQGELGSRWEEVLREHISISRRARTDEGWEYKQKLVDLFPFPAFWDQMPEMIRVLQQDGSRLVSLPDIQAESLITTILYSWPPGERIELLRYEFAPTSSPPSLDIDDLGIRLRDLNRLSEAHRKAIFANRRVSSIRRLPSGHLAIDWRVCEDTGRLFASSADRPVGLVDLQDDNIVGFRLHQTTGNVYAHIVLNASNPFVQWMVRVERASRSESYSMIRDPFTRLMSLMLTPLNQGGYEIEEVEQFVGLWNTLPSLPPELMPPEFALTPRMFMPTIFLEGISRSSLELME